MLEREKERKGRWVKSVRESVHMYVVGDGFSLESRNVSAKLSILNLIIIIIAKQTLPAAVSDITKVSQPLSLISHKVTNFSVL